MAAKQRETMFECEVKRKRLAASGTGYEAFWRTKSVQDALDDNDSEFRCKACHGGVKLIKRRVATGPASHVEHLHKADAEYCSAGLPFQQATDGRVSRWSENPVL